MAGLIFCWVASVAFTAYLAHRQGRDVRLWAIAGCLLPILSIIMIAVLPRKGEKDVVGHLVGLGLILLMFGASIFIMNSRLNKEREIQKMNCDLPPKR